MSMTTSSWAGISGKGPNCAVTSLPDRLGGEGDGDRDDDDV
jgi:hypothetical protein